MSRRRSAPRRRSREVALQVLYAVDVAGGARPEARPAFETAFADVAANFELAEGARAFAKELVCGVAACAEELDALLAAHARNWRLSRMAAVDRNILRLATWELLRTETPTAVILEEAVELARRFGADASPAFVNGVLDAVGRALRETPP